MAAIGLWCIAPATPEVGVTDACQDDVKELMDEINDIVARPQPPPSRHMHFLISQMPNLPFKRLACVALRIAVRYDQKL